VIKARHSLYVFAERAREGFVSPSAQGNVSWWPVAGRDYEAIFVGGGLTAMLFLRELGSALSGRVAVLDPYPPSERPTVQAGLWKQGRPLPPSQRSSLL
jgi:hypothetical protein